jgi:hypothetical protein
VIISLVLKRVDVMTESEGCRDFHRGQPFDPVAGQLNLISTLCRTYEIELRLIVWMLPLNTRRLRRFSGNLCDQGVVLVVRMSVPAPKAEQDRPRLRNSAQQYVDAVSNPE